MKALAKEIRGEIDNICGGYRYYKDENVLGRAEGLAGRIQKFCSGFLQGNLFGLEEEEYLGLQNYVIQVLKDYMESVKQQDMVYMLDTLDYGLRELVNIYTDAEETGYE